MSPTSLLQPLNILVHIWEDISMNFIEWLSKFNEFSVILVTINYLNKYVHFSLIKT